MQTFDEWMQNFDECKESTEFPQLVFLVIVITTLEIYHINTSKWKI